MAIDFLNINIAPSSVNAGQGFIIQIKVASISLLLDSDGELLRDENGVQLIAKQEVA